ncbi:MAG: N-acetylmuramoyl-L-alanine amidase family protein, partial [Candidatus Gastranaerophilaceae bacterium]
ILNTLVAEIGVNNDKVRQGSLALVRNTNALSLLIEVSYLINPEDNANLINPEFQKQYAKAVVDSLEKYFGK